MRVHIHCFGAIAPTTGYGSLGAGIGTGFAGMSAAAVISPMLITFLGFPAYEAVGIALVHP